MIPVTGQSARCLPPLTQEAINQIAGDGDCTHKRAIDPTLTGLSYALTWSIDTTAMTVKGKKSVIIPCFQKNLAHKYHTRTHVSEGMVYKSCS